MSTDDLQHFDHHDKGFAQDPYDVYRRMRQACPVMHSDAHGGFTAITSYEGVVEVAKDDYTFLSSPGVTFPPIPKRAVLPIEADPPEFFKYRRMLNPWFSPPAVAAWEPALRSLAQDLLAPHLAAGRIDITKDFARLLPAVITLRLIGLPEADAADYLQRIEELIHHGHRDVDASVETGLHVYQALAEEMERREDANDTGTSDLLGFLMNTDVEGERLTEEEIMDMVFLLLFGGLDTTAAAIGNAVVYLSAHPEARDRLIAEPELIPLAVDEFLRFEAPVQGLARTVATQCTVGGQPLEVGEKVMIFWAAANRDEDVFDRPDEVVLDRQPNRHLAFGVGNHRCLGSNLARLEFRVALEELLAAVPDFSIDLESAQRWDDLGVVYGWQSLPATFTPAPERALSGTMGDT